MESNIILHGSTENLPSQVRINAGMLSAIYENGFLRYLKFGEVEVLRLINHIIRDSDWNTVPMVIIEEKINIGTDAFHIQYIAQCQQDDINFLWNCEIVGHANSTITFSIKGISNSNFQKNRIGFTVLHPIESCMGKECTIVHSDGKIQEKKFPVDISPIQPFLDISSMSWNPDESIKALLNFEGEIFETEDQRNWTDASYKTYCTPLAKPFPITIRKGESVHQLITFQIFTSKKSLDLSKTPFNFQLDRSRKLPIPKIGTCFNTLVPSAFIINQIQSLGLDFLRLELDMDVLDETMIDSAVQMAINFKCKLELVLFFNNQINHDFIYKLWPLSEYIGQFIILSKYKKCTDENLIDEIVPILRNNFPKSEIGAGTDAFFKELNSDRVPTDNIDFLSFSINPQVHAFDLGSLTETLECQYYVVESCKQFSKGKGVHVGPISLRMRWNPNATNNSKTQGTQKDNELGNADLRQLSLYGASWTLGSFKYLSESGAKAVTYYEVCGVKGLVAHPQEPWPKAYQIPEECVYPIYLVIKELLKQKGKWILPLISSSPLEFDGIAFMNDSESEITIIIFNLTNLEKTLTLLDIGENMKVKSIQASNVESLMNSNFNGEKVEIIKAKKKLLLKPYEITIMEFF